MSWQKILKVTEQFFLLIIKITVYGFSLYIHFYSLKVSCKLSTACIVTEKISSEASFEEV